MNLLAMLLALASELLLSSQRDAARMGGRGWRLAQRLLPWPAFWASPLTPILLTLLPAIAAGAIHAALTESPYAVPLRLAFDALVLFVCMGPRDLSDDIKRLRAARAANDHDAANRIKRSLQIGPSPDADHRSLLGALFIQSHERLFGVLWWFLLAGPAGAVLYRVARRLPCLIEDSESPAGLAASGLHAVLAWFPARLTALLFGLAGSFDDALRTARELHDAPHTDWKRHTWNLLGEVSSAALDWEDSGVAGSGPAVTASLDAILREVLRLQARALLIFLALTALLNAGAWLA